MTPGSSPTILVTRRGLYCPPGDFYIDPCRPVQNAVITHGHGDHLRRGSAHYILARPGEGIAHARLPDDADIAALDYGVPRQVGGVTISLHPAGHILGSAQVRIEHAGEVWVISGDYKRQSDPTCLAFEPIECDVFISEATFAQPVFCWPPTLQAVAEIVHWWRDNRERGVASVLFCYALGKAQRVLAEMLAFTQEPVYVNDAVGALVEVYRRAGVAMLPTLPLTAATPADCRGALLLVPPSAAGTPWLRRFGAQSSGFCSGWIQQHSDRRRPRHDRGFVISDHADWPALVHTCTETRARRVLFTHGDSDALARHLRQQGVDAQALESTGTAGH